MSRQIVIEDNGPVSRIIIPVQPGCTVLHGYCGVGKSKTLEAVAVALGNKGLKLSPREGTKRGKVDCLGVVLSIAPGRTTTTGESEVATIEDFSLGDLIDPPVKDISARNRHGIKSLLRLTEAAADPAAFYHLVGGKKEDFDKLVVSADRQAVDLVDLAGKIKRALEKASRNMESLADTESTKADGLRNAGDALDMTAETNPAELQTELTEAAAAKGALDERAKAAQIAFDRATEATRQLENAGHNAVPMATLEDALTAAQEKLDTSQSNASRDKGEVARLEIELKQANAAYGLSLVVVEAAAHGVLLAEAAIDAAKCTDAAIAGWQAAIDAAANVKTPTIAELQTAANRVAVAQQAIEQAAVVRAAKDKLAQVQGHQAEANKYRLEAERLRTAAKATDTVLSEAVGSGRFSVNGEVLMGTLPTGECKPYYNLSDGERTIIAVAEKIERLRTTEADPQRLGIIDLPQRTYQDLPPSVRKGLTAQAVASNICIVTAEVTDDPKLTANILTGE